MSSNFVISLKCANSIYLWNHFKEPKTHVELIRRPQHLEIQEYYVASQVLFMSLIVVNLKLNCLSLTIQESS